VAASHNAQILIGNDKEDRLINNVLRHYRFS
jgi:hypothetical protein